MHRYILAPFYLTALCWKIDVLSAKKKAFKTKLWSKVADAYVLSLLRRYCLPEKKMALGSYGIKKQRIFGISILFGSFSSSARPEAFAIKVETYVKLHRKTLFTYGESVELCSLKVSATDVVWTGHSTRRTDGGQRRRNTITSSETHPTPARSTKRGAAPRQTRPR